MSFCADKAYVNCGHEKFLKTRTEKVEKNRI